MKNRLGKVYVDPAMKNYALPLAENTSQGGYGVLSKGARIPFDEEKSYGHLHIGKKSMILTFPYLRLLKRAGVRNSRGGQWQDNNQMLLHIQETKRVVITVALSILTSIFLSLKRVIRNNGILYFAIMFSQE